MAEIVDNFLDDDYDEKNDRFLDARLAAAVQDQAPTPSKDKELNRVEVIWSNRVV